MIGKQVLLFGNQIINGLKEFRRLVVRKTDGTACIKAGDGFDATEIDGVRVKNELDGCMKLADFSASVGRIMSPILWMPLTSTLDLVIGSGSATFARASSATYIDRYGVVQKVGSDVPRFEKEGLLIEGSGTNLLTYSEEFDNAAWHKGDCSVSANATTAPDNTNTAEGIIAGTTDQAHYLHQIRETNSDQVSCSIFAKRGNKNWITLNIEFLDDSNNHLVYNYVWINLTDGSVGHTTGNITATVIPLAYDWYYIKVTSEYSGSSTVKYSRLWIYPAESDADSAFAGDGSTINTYIWGAQLEEFPHSTSYIPTTSASATRAGDNCYIEYEGNIPEAYKDNFTVIADASANGFTLAQKVIYRTNNDFWRGLEFSKDNYNIHAYYGSTSIYYTLPSYDSCRLGQAVEGSVNKLFVNGDLKNTATWTSPSSTPVRNRIDIGMAGGGQYLYGHISNLRIYDVALTEEEMKIA